MHIALQVWAAMPRLPQLRIAGTELARAVRLPSGLACAEVPVWRPQGWIAFASRRYFRFKVVNLSLFVIMNLSLFINGNSRVISLAPLNPGITKGIRSN